MTHERSVLDEGEIDFNAIRAHWPSDFSSRMAGPAIGPHDAILLTGSRVAGVARLAELLAS